MAACGTLAGALFSHSILFPSTMAFFATFSTPDTRLTPTLENTFDLYKNMLLGMVAVFQLPTLVFFLARLRLVTAGFLWRHIKYAILIVFIAAALLTSSPDPWNQTIVAAPMLAMYVLSIGVAWVVRPRDAGVPPDSPARHLALLIAAFVTRQTVRLQTAPRV
jgi:sec-independent protein translocase protein TatC